MLWVQAPSLQQDWPVTQLAESETFNLLVVGSSPAGPTCLVNVYKKFNTIIDLIVESFYVYYGLDWIAFISGVTGMYLLSEKQRIGFVLQGLSVTFATICSIIASQFGFVASNLVMLVIVIYGYLNWKNKNEKIDK